MCLLVLRFVCLYALTIVVRRVRVRDGVISCMCAWYVARVNLVSGRERVNVGGVKREVSFTVSWKNIEKKSEARVRRILRGLSTHRRQRASRRGFSLSERGLRKSSLPPLSLVSWNHSVFLVYFVPLSSPSLSLGFSLSVERVSRSDMALPIGADTPRGVEADSTRVESFVRSSIRRPSSPLLCSLSRLFPSVPVQLLPS